MIETSFINTGFFLFIDLPQQHTYHSLAESLTPRAVRIVTIVKTETPPSSNPSSSTPWKAFPFQLLNVVRYLITDVSHESHQSRAAQTWTSNPEIQQAVRILPA